jgi:hypothetical protein
MATWTVIDEQRAVTVRSGDDLLVDPSVLGWTRKPEGLCREHQCLTVPAGTAPGPLPARMLARLLDRPLVVDDDERVAVFGASAAARADALRSGTAPDLALPDLDGVTHELSGLRGHKAVLYAWASW